MEREYWERKWAEQDLGFHNPDIHPMLVKHLPGFDLPKGARILVPLCGKSLDLHGLRAAGYHVIGIELVETAVQDLFEALGVSPTVTQDGGLIRYCAEGIEVFVGDIFAVRPEQVGPVDFVYDRAALIALPEAMRSRYTPHLLRLSGRAPQLLITFDYVQADMDGPPFYLSATEIAAHYGEIFDITVLDSRPVEDMLKGRTPAVEITRSLHVR